MSDNSSTYNAGQVVPCGFYVCGECGEENLAVVFEGTKLPKCPKCDGYFWIRYLNY